MTVRTERHWEPGWIDAYGGTVETTALALDAFGRDETTRRSAFARDAAAYLLSTRSSWGAWHNTRGTVWAIRALSSLPLGTERAGAHVHVEVDGRVVADRAIDARDPWASTLALRDIELTDLPRGSHRLTVRYDGALVPTVSVEHTRWGSTGAAPAPDAPRLTLLAPAVATTGDSVELGFRLERLRRARLVRVSIPVPPYGDPDAASLRSLVANGTIAGFQIGARTIELVMANPSSEVGARFRVRIPRAGHYTLTGAHAQVDGGPRTDAPPAVLDVR